MGRFRRWGLSAVSVVLVVAAAGCYRGPRAGHVRTIPPPEHWQRVQPAQTGFSCALPGPPEITRETSQDFDGTPVRTTVGRVIAANAAVFGFTVMEAQGGFIQDPYARARRAAEPDDEKEEVVRWEKEFRYGGFVGRDRIIDLPMDQVTLYIRLLLGKTRVFGMFTVYPTRAEGQAKPLIDAYLSSVQLDPSEAVSPMGDGMLALDGWQYIYPPEADFAIRMPGSAGGIEEEGQIGDAETTVRRYGVQSQSGSEVFEVVVHGFEGESPPDGAIAEAEQRMKNRGFTVAEEHFVHQRGFGGRAVVFRSQQQTVHVHYYSTLGRLYEVRVWSGQGAGPRLESARKRFLQSFRIL